jgi:hypothetical protein
VVSDLHLLAIQVKVAEHVLTGHKVAIKILNRRKIKQMDMEEKGRAPFYRPASRHKASSYQQLPAAGNLPL